MPDLKTVQCSYHNCNFVSTLHADELIDGKWYCPGHQMGRVNDQLFKQPDPLPPIVIGPEDYKTLNLEQAKAIAQAAAKRLADCTRKEALNDVWAAAMTKLLENEMYAFMDWMFYRRDPHITGLVEDSYSPEDVILNPDRDTIKMLVNEFAAYRKPE